MQAYFDFNATAPIRREAIDAMNEAMGLCGNASSVHSAGRTARSIVEMARNSVASLVGAESESVIFCGSGTEADNQALRCVSVKNVIISAVEHEAVMQAFSSPVKVSVGADGVVNLAALETSLAESKEKTLVSVMAANNETGVIQPIKEISRIARQHNAIMHNDAIQAAGKIPINVYDWDVDLLSLSAHKIGGPQGVGALIVNNPVSLNRFVHGGGQERGLRAGTENVAGIAGFGAAAEAALAGLDGFNSLREMRDSIEIGLLEIDPLIKIFGQDSERLPNTSKLASPGFSSETQVMGMDLAGFAISAGSACASGRVEAPYVLAAMGVDDYLAKSAIRISLGWTTTEKDVEAFVKQWSKLFSRSRSRTFDDMRS